MKIGLFFGSFNPVHIGHMIIANYMANYTDLEQVWLVVSPHNPLKEKSDLINMYDRLEMAKLATEETLNIRVSDVELKLPQPSYTIDTLTFLHEKYPEHEFSLIMGSDNLTSIKKWKNYELILRDYHIHIYPRPGFEIQEFKDHPSITITETPLMELSATFIRKAVKEGKNVHFVGLLSDGGVHAHIDHVKGLCDAAKANGLTNVFIHAFLDGRDTDPKSGLGFIHSLNKHLKTSVGTLASAVGRYYAMDRDNRWERVKLAYDLLVKGQGKACTNIADAVEQSYNEGITDEFMPALVGVDAEGKVLTHIAENDVVICFNFRRLFPIKIFKTSFSKLKSFFM